MDGDRMENAPPNEATIPASVDNAELLEKRSLEAELCIKNYVILAMGVGLVPSALVDIVGITALEVKMIGDLARVYDFPIPKKLIIYKILISLVGSIGPVYLSGQMHAALKSIPLVGHAVYVGMLSVTGGAAVYAVGKIFQRHYESGGTFLSSENRVLKKYYQEQYAAGKKVVPLYAHA